MFNIDGPRPNKHRLMMKAAQAMRMHGANIWTERLSMHKCRKCIAAVQRRGIMRVTYSYRTVSEPTVLVEEGIITIDLLAKERKVIFERKLRSARPAQEQRRALAACGAGKNVGRPMYEEDDRLIGPLVTWIERQHGKLDTNRYRTWLLPV